MAGWRTWAFFVPALAWAAFLFWLSSRQAFPDYQPPFPHFDKVVHFGLYFVLGALLAGGDVDSRRARLFWIVVAVAYGMTDELHQAMVPGRTPSALDLVADAFGSVGGVFLTRYFHQARTTT